MPDANTLAPGDLFGLGGNRIYQVVDLTVVQADAGGVATFTIRPPLRAAAATDDPVTIERPKLVMRLMADDQAENPMRRPGKADYSFTLVEDFA